MRGTIAKRLRRAAKVLGEMSEYDNERMYVQHKNGRITIFWVGERRIYLNLKKEWKSREKFINSDSNVIHIPDTIGG